ncbi:MAG: hypothetical protein ACREU7_01215 [Burkholderiales bacterium]
MNFLFGLLGAVLLVGLMVGWYVLHRRITGESPLSGGEREADRGAGTELEAFIAAYRAGKVSPEQLRPESPGAPAGAGAPVAAAAPGVVASPVFMRPEVKLAYLTFRAGLRDHHVFANVHLADLARDAGNARVDLLVLDAKFLPVAAVDVCRPGEETRAETLAALRAAGVRYLRLQSTAMPRPGDLHTLVYRA